MPRLTVNGLSLHYRLVGSVRPAFVLVHGGCCALTDWDTQVAALADEFTVFAMDLRGHGGSSSEGELSVPQWAADVNALVAALEIGEAVIVGHSLGARIAAEAVTQAPGRYAGIVLIDGSRTVGGLSATEGQQVIGGTLEQILDRTIGPYADDDTRAKVIATMSAPPEPMMWACVTALEDWDRDRADAVYPALDMPVLAIQSTYHDRFTARRSFASTAESSPYLDHLRAAVPHLQVEIIPDSGHFSMMEYPNEVTALICGFGLAVTR